MNPTRILMRASVVLLGTLGLGATFLPHEILARLGAPASPVLVVVLQVTGALYLGFAILNWMSRNQLLGGIYNRPLALANLLHFASAALALGKALAAHPETRVLWPLAAAYALLAAGFGAVLFRHPVPAPAAPRDRG